MVKGGGAGGGQRRLSREFGSVRDLLGIDERDMRGDLLCHARVPGATQLFHELAAARIKEGGDVVPRQSYNGSLMPGQEIARKASATRQ
jgi:hypothetical protein